MAVQVADLFLERVPQFVRGAPQLPQTLSQSAGDFRQLPGPEEQKGQEEDETDREDVAAEQRSLSREK
jgi:hypothetical protein